MPSGSPGGIFFECLKKTSIAALRIARTTIKRCGLANLKKLFKTIELARPI
jgi:hypothetical protein